MRYQKILITGASGFIGSRLCEKLALQYKVPHRALVRNFGRAARIARLGTEMVAGDLSDQASLKGALSGCDAVVHLAFSSTPKVEEALVSACRHAAIRRFVHISSAAVHGPNPGPECAREETATIRHYGESYSDAKARAEKVVQQAIDEGLPGVILRPTIVYGPYSSFVTDVVKAAGSGTISLIDDGKGICNAVFVDDVCDAIYAALDSDAALGKALFVNADRAVSWKEFNLTFANMVQPQPSIENISAQEARMYWASTKPSFRSNVVALKRLVTSADFHDRLGTVPAFRSGITWTKAILKRILTADQVKAAQRIVNSGSREVARPEWPDPGRLVREDFHREFSNELAKQSLGWRPKYDFPAGAALTRTWLEFTRMLGPTVR